MKNITHIQLILLLATIRKSTFVNMVTRTVVKMNKTGNPFYNLVYKVRTGNYLVGNEYENRVNNNLEKEGKDSDFVASKNNVGDHVTKSLLYNSNTEKYYLQYERFDNSPIDTLYTFKGLPIDKAQFERFISGSTSYENQGLTKTVKVQSVTTSNILSITVDGTRYNVVD